MIDPSQGATFSPDLMAQLREERATWTREQCLQVLDEGTESLLVYLRSLSDEALTQPLTLPMGGSTGLTLPIAGWFMMVYRAFISRFAQINYIQTLYGDFDFH